MKKGCKGKYKKTNGWRKKESLVEWCGTCVGCGVGGGTRSQVAGRTRKITYRDDRTPGSSSFFWEYNAFDSSVD